MEDIKNIEENEAKGPRLDIEGINLNIATLQPHETPEYMGRKVKETVSRVMNEAMKEVNAFKALKQKVTAGYNVNAVSNTSSVNSTTANVSSSISKNTVTQVQQNEQFGVFSTAFDASAEEQIMVNDPIREGLIKLLRKKLDILNAKPIPLTPPIKANPQPPYKEVQELPNPFKQHQELDKLINELRDASIPLSKLYQLYPSLIDYHQELIRNNPNIVPYPDTRDLRSTLVRKIQEKFTDAKDSKGKKIKKTEKAIDFWKYIIQQLQDSAVPLSQLFEEKQDLFLLLSDILDVPAYVSVSEQLKMEFKTYPNFLGMYPTNINKDTIYPKLGKLKDEDGRAVSIIQADKMDIHGLPGTELSFCVEEDNTSEKEQFRNWTIHQLIEGKWKQIENHVDVGSRFNKRFANEGIYVIEAYGKKYYTSYYSRNVKRIANKENGKKPYFYLIIKAPELVDIKTEVKSHVRKGDTVYTFTAITDIKDSTDLILDTLVWEVKHSTTSAKEGFKIIKDYAQIDCLEITFKEEGWYKIEARTSDKVKVSKQLMVGGNWVTRIKETKNQYYILFNTKQKITYKTIKYKLPKISGEEKETCWEILYGNTRIDTKSNTETITWDGQNAKEGTYTVKAYTKTGIFGKKETQETFTVVHPKVTNAYWADANGNKKQYTGFGGEESYICATIDYYANKEVCIDIYCDGKKLNKDSTKIKTDTNGKVKYKFILEAYYQNLLSDGQKLQFKIKGYNYALKEEDRLLSKDGLTVISNKKVSDTYFIFERQKVQTDTHALVLGSKVKAVVQTVNMLEENITIGMFKTKDKNTQAASPIIEHKIPSPKTDKDGSDSYTFVFDDKLIKSEDVGCYFYLDVKINDTWNKNLELVKNSCVYVIDNKNPNYKTILDKKKLKILNPADHGDWHDPIRNPHLRGHYKPGWDTGKSVVGRKRVQGKRQPDGTIKYFKRYHGGLDIYGPVGTPIYASVDGKVTRHEFQATANGCNIRFNTTKEFRGNRYTILYLHMMDFITYKDRFAIGGKKGEAKYYKYEDYLVTDKITIPTSGTFEVTYNKQANTLKIDNMVIDLNIAKKNFNGKDIKKGQVVGYVGLTGNALQDRKTSHVHLAMYRNGKEIDPSPLLKDYITDDVKGETKNLQDGKTPSSDF